MSGLIRLTPPLAGIPLWEDLVAEIAQSADFEAVPTPPKDWILTGLRDTPANFHTALAELLPPHQERYPGRFYLTAYTNFLQDLLRSDKTHPGRWETKGMGLAHFGIGGRVVLDREAILVRSIPWVVFLCNKGASTRWVKADERPEQWLHALFHSGGHKTAQDISRSFAKWHNDCIPHWIVEEISR